VKITSIFFPRNSFLQQDGLIGKKSLKTGLFGFIADIITVHLCLNRGLGIYFTVS